MILRFDRFTERAQDAAARAYETMMRYGHGQIDTEHLLLALLEQPEGIASTLLPGMGVGVDAMKADLEHTLRQSPHVSMYGPGSALTPVFITPRVKRVLDVASEEADSLNDAYIGPEHLLLAISTEVNTHSVRLLDAAKVTHASLRDSISRTRSVSVTRPPVPTDQILYHIGFSRADLGDEPPTLALLCGDPDRASMIAQTHMTNVKKLSEHRGLNSYLGTLPNGRRIISATSGMGAPSLSIVVNELVQAGITTVIRIGTCGSIQDRVRPGSVVITSAALCRQGAANDIAPVEYPAAADPFVTVKLAEAAKALGVEYHVGVTASVDSFYEGQERIGSANPHLQRWLQGITEEYRRLNVLNYEMESGTLFKMGGVYGFAAACVCGVVAQRTASEQVLLDAKAGAVENAIRVAIETAQAL